MAELIVLIASIIAAIIVMLAVLFVVLTNRTMIEENRNEINRIYKMMEEQGRYVSEKFDDINAKMTTPKKVVKKTIERIPC